MNFKINNNFNLSNIKSYNATKNAYINHVVDEGTYGPPNLNDPETYDKMNKDQANFMQKLGTGKNIMLNYQGLTTSYIERLKNVSDYKQDNPNLSSIPLDGYTMGDSGCMISSLMGIYYLYTGKQIDVTKFIKDVQRDKLWTKSTCGNPDTFSNSVTHAVTTNWGLSASRIHSAEINSNLQNGKKILVCVDSNSPLAGPGNGHYLVLDHINPNTGDIYIYNPNSKYEGYVNKEFLESNVLNHLTADDSGLWCVTYNKNHTSMSQSVSANKYNAPEFNFETLDQNTLETLYETSKNVPLSNDNPNVDLGATSFKNVENFNQYIKDNINSAGYGTRAGVVAAGLSLISGYNFATGKRLRYSQPLRQVNTATNSVDQEGIVNENFYLDCSSFAWWSLYNGGFKIPVNSTNQLYTAYTGNQEAWAKNTGNLKSSENGKPGDFLINSGHIVLIVGNYDGGYYCAEFSNPSSGAQITKRSFSELNNLGYNLMDMESYYSDSNNVR